MNAIFRAAMSRSTSSVVNNYTTKTTEFERTIPGRIFLYRVRRISFRSGQLGCPGNRKAATGGSTATGVGAEDRLTGERAKGEIMK
jgi:hypothetical protein